MTNDEMIKYDAIPESAWARLSRAADDPRQMLRLMAVATVMPDGRPSNRTLVLRGADRSSGLVWFHSDRRSPKILHLKQRPFVSALGYDSHDQLQIRLDGQVTLHENDALAERHWEQVSVAVRYAYSLPYAPGESLQQADPRLHTLKMHQQTGQSDQGRNNFVVLQLRVEMIDWLQVCPMGQTRAVLRADSGWKPEPVVP